MKTNGLRIANMYLATDANRHLYRLAAYPTDSRRGFVLPTTWNTLPPDTMILFWEK